MTTIDLNLINFSCCGILLETFKRYSNDYQFTANGVFRKIVPPECPECGTPMVHNGYNVYTKNRLGDVKIGRYYCPNCKKSCEEYRDFWKDMILEFFDDLNGIYQLMRSYHVSYEGIALVMGRIYPRGKDAIHNAFTESTENAEVSSSVEEPIECIRIVHYDEQYLKVGRMKKFRLTLVDGVTNCVIAEELHDRKDSETIKSFFRRNLDLSKRIFLVTDHDKNYPKIFQDLFGNNVIHQNCLLHLNKLIVKDFPKKTTMAKELLKYRLLNIFYNRDAELELLGTMAKEEEKIKSELPHSDYMAWLVDKLTIFRKFLHDRELRRRRNKELLEHRSYEDALKLFNELMQDKDSFSVSVQKRLVRIKINWNRLTAFYFVDGAPATNNIIENYYSTSLKTHRKKQLRTDKGIEIHMKLSAMKRAGMLDTCNRTLLDTFLKFIPFLKAG